MSSEDLVFPRGLFGLELTRAYRSDRTTLGWFGRGWATVYETTLRNNPSGAVINAPAGLAPLWAPEAPDGWNVTGSASIRTTAAGATDLVWPSGETWSFGANGSLGSITAPYGQKVTIERNGGALSAIRSSQGPSIVFETNGGRVVTARTDDGREVRFAYESDRLVNSSAPGLELGYTYNADDQMVQLDGPSGKTSISYAAGSVSGQTTASGQRVTLERAGGRTTVHDVRTLSYQHDVDGRLIRVTDENNDVAVRRFDGAGRLVESTEYSQPGKQVLRELVRTYEGDRLMNQTSNGVSTAFEYDERGRDATTRTGDQSITFDYASDLPLPSAVTSPKGGREAFSYTDGFVTGAVDATGVSSNTGRDKSGNPVSRATAAQPAWSYQFDAEGNVTTTSAPSGRTWSATWGPLSTLLGEHDPLGRESIYKYDAAGHLVEQRLPGDLATRYVYNTSGRLAQETSPDGLNTRYEYDQAGQLAATILPGELIWRSSTQRSDAGSSTITVTAPDATSTVSTIDSAGREIQRRSLEANGTVVETQQHAFEFDRPTDTVVLRGDSRFESRTTYDQMARIVATTDTLGGTQVGLTTYMYDHGNVANASNAQQHVNYRYDDAGRLIKVSADSNVWEATYESGRLAVTSHNDAHTKVGYDIDGRATTFVGNAGITTVWKFDGADRPIARSIGDAQASFKWSSGDQLTYYRSPDGSHWEWSYDRAGRVLSASEPAGTSTTYEYHNGSVTKIHSSVGSEGRDDRFAYDSRGLLQTAHTAAGEFKYAYDATSKPTTIDGDGKEQWAYDAMGNVVSVQAGPETFALDYGPSGRIQAINGPKTSIEATWAPDGLAGVTATGRDALRLATDTKGRLSIVQWNDKTAVDLKWSSDSTSLELRDRGSDKTQTYQLADGHLAAFSADNLKISSIHQDNGYLQSLDLENNKDLRGQISFDQVGRPATLVTDAASSTLTYDSDGRARSVLTTRAGKAPDQTLVSYDAYGRHIEGDKKIVEALFADDGSLRTPLPSSLPNPISAANTLGNLARNQLGAASELLVAPEPRPLDDINASITNSTPPVTTPIGVRDLPRLAEQMVVAEVARLAPTLRVNGDTAVRLPVVNLKSGKLADFNPFINAAPSGLVLGILSSQGGGGDSLLNRAKDTVGDIVGGSVALAIDVAKFAIDNPIARLVISAGTWVAATAACAGLVGACVPLAAAAVFIAAGESGQLLMTSTMGALRSCSRNELEQCGIWVAGGALAIAGAIAATGVGVALAQTYFAGRLYSAAIESGIGVAQASGQVGTAKSEVLAALRLERIVDEEVPVCVQQTCARLDLVTRDVLGRNRFIEVKNGAGARLTANQQIVYPILRTSGGYFPNGLAGGSPQMLFARLDLQHWGTNVPLVLP